MNICKLKEIVPLFPRSSFTDGVVSTGKSFRSWDTCMDNKACKIIAIVGIVLACILVIWLIGGLLTCFRQGVTGIGQFICWCCRCSNDKNGNNTMPVNEGFSRVNMGVAPPSTVIYQPIQQPESAYYRNDAKNDTFYDEVKTPSNEVYELEEDFDLEKQKKTRKKQQKERNKEGRSPSRVAPLVYEEENFEGSSPQPQYDARNSFIQNAANTGSNNAHVTSQSQFLTSAIMARTTITIIITSIITSRETVTILPPLIIEVHIQPKIINHIRDINQTKAIDITNEVNIYSPFF